ncbi:MAG: sporulation protein YqfD [Oscillospiraceae bacterium]|nr:sporulation protein YqfD [Oscillospiraceae bacterium]
MDLWKSLNGMVQMELTSADPAAAISQVNGAGIAIYGADRADDDIKTRFYVRRQDVKKLKALAEKRGYDLSLSRRRGIYWIGKQFLHRPILTIGMLLFLLIALYLPTRVYFFEIEGNTTIPTRLILEKCQQCGISFGVSRREVRSEKMKNALLQAIPELQWAGINTSGCTAIITVRERTPAQLPQENCGVSSIVATRDGVITECTVTRGNPVCKVGQAVKAGEVLISGYTDCGIAIQATQAKGEVYAATNRTISAVTPLNWQSQGSKTVTEKKYSVIIGKKQINFYKGSGISPVTCDKMYSESYVTLPGGFQLPIIVVTETWIYYEETAVTLPEPSLSNFAQRYLQEQMIAGTVISRLESGAAEDGLYRFQGNYACTEMIGQVRSEETLKPYEQHD